MKSTLVEEINTRTESDIDNRIECSNRKVAKVRVDKISTVGI